VGHIRVLEAVFETVIYDPHGDLWRDNQGENAYCLTEECS
jgi:hypothetical protein